MSQRLVALWIQSKTFFLLFDNSKCILYLLQKLDFLRIIHYMKIFFLFESRALRFITTDSDPKVYSC